ncbi:MAG TPA: FtsX-like permease family protein [Catenuloplanes sp.]|jgi:putative ABC transport system permease protein
MLRATLKSLLSRKLRLTLSALAVVLGVMFVSGAFVLTDTLGRSFDALFADVYARTDVAVTAKPKVAVGEFEGESVPAAVPAATVAKVAAVPGVAKATGLVTTDGARVIGANGKVLTTFGPPRLGGNWVGTDDFVQLREGRGPTAAGEIAVNAAVAKAAGLKVGDQVGVLTLQPKRMFTLVGVWGYSGGQDSLGGTQEVAFTEPVAQELMLGQSGVYSNIDVKAAPGTSPAQLKTAVAAALGADFEVKTGAELTSETTAEFREGLKFFNYFLLGFAAVALFVGIFLILNTFSIIVAQRTRELALMRAVGASRRQMIGSVMVEAVAIGLIASVVGLGAGIGVGALLAWLFSSIGTGGLQLAGIGVPPSAVISAFGVGVIVTVVAALLPALRASRIPPIAALQEAATPDRPLTRLTIAGTVIAAIGGTVLGLGLAGQDGNTLTFILVGVLVSFIGVALLTPIIARPVVSVLGRAFSWSVPGKLGRLNSGRNPRRTAITAAALMVGLALITGVNVILDSVTKSLHQIVDTQVKTDLIISGDGSSGPATFDPAVLTKAQALPGVAAVAGDYFDRAAINGKQTFVHAVTDLPTFARMFSMTASGGSLGPLRADQLVVDNESATEAGVKVGDTVRVQFSRGELASFTVAAIYPRGDVNDGWLFPAAVTKNFRTDQPAYGYVTVAPGGSVSAVSTGVAALLADSPEVNVADRSAFVDQQAAQLDSLVNMIQILLALAILIAVLGIINTLALSVLERTRELGLLRAIGLKRGQMVRMVTVEAVVISLFGALLGLVVGTGLGAAVVRALKDDGITAFAVPWTAMGTYFVLAGLVGVLAAILPAIRAARVNVLTAIAHD